MKINNSIKLFTAVILTVGLGAVGGLVTAPEIPLWYAGLNKPSFNPPNWLFGPVWTTLYLLMGVSCYLVWRQPVSVERNKALYLFILQFVLNFCWSFIFFGMHETGWALTEMIILWLTILATIFSFAKFSKTAAWLLVPYIAWVSFAMLLNGAIWRLNGE
jgi:benzodiazapine receptor